MRRPFRVLAIAGAAVALIAAAPSTAGAVSTSPTGIDFGAQPVGTTSGPHAVSLTVPCSLPVPVLNTCPGFAVDAYYVHVSTTGDFAAASNCPNPLGPTLTELLGSCTINVAFVPAGTGTRRGTLNTGTTDILGTTPGPAVALSGTGTSPTGTSSGSPTGSTSGQKKCKKKHRKHKRHGKKCKKKKKRR
jgi:hypothetical protein